MGDVKFFGDVNCFACSFKQLFVVLVADARFVALGALRPSVPLNTASADARNFRHFKIACHLFVVIMPIT